jgi:hypothetical protein
MLDKKIINTILLTMKEKIIRYEDLKNPTEQSIVYVIQEIAGTAEGRPKINIMGATEYGEFEFLLPELSQIIFSPGPLIFKLKKRIKRLYNRQIICY